MNEQQKNKKFSFNFISRQETGFDVVRTALWEESSSSDLVMFIDSDDWIADTYIYNHLKQHIEHPEISASQLANISQFMKNRYIEIQHLGICPQICRLIDVFPDMVYKVI